MSLCSTFVNSASVSWTLVKVGDDLNAFSQLTFFLKGALIAGVAKLSHYFNNTFLKYPQLSGVHRLGKNPNLKGS